MSPEDVGEQKRKDEDTLLKESKIQVNCKHANDGSVFPNNRPRAEDLSSAAAAMAASTPHDASTPPEATTLPDTTEADTTEGTGTPSETTTLPDTTGADTTHDAGTTLAATTSPDSTRQVLHCYHTTLAATTRDPNIIGVLPEDTPLELEEIDHVYDFAVQIDQEYSADLADENSDLYKEASSNFTNTMTPYYNATAGFKEIRNIVFSPLNEASAVRSAAILAVENPTKVDYEVVYEYTAMDNKELTCEELKTDSDPPLTYVGDCGDPEVVNVCDYAVDSSCESGFQQVEVDYQCVCQSKCKQGYCENDGKCEHTDEIKCWCSSDSNYFYVGDRCQSKLNKTAMIAVISVSAALFLIIIIILVVCLAKSRRRKDTTKYTDQPNNRQSRSYPDGSHYYNPQIPSYDNQGFLQTLDHEIDSSNPDEMNDTIAMETFQGHNGHMSGVPEHTANPRGNNYERYEPMSDDMDVYPHPWTSATNNDTHEPMAQPTNVNRWSSYAANPAAGNRLSFNLDNIDPYKDVKIRRAKFNPDRLSKNLTVDVEANI
ncbi:interphotoreceptor matrix proteoglycan 2-like [Ptychodera flava]|uniref:interphotoreceptor matrix proteoglycan 2-like n=1 Tax=Ptychodera flava TaxID=63121 RepID=UPI003969D64C